MKRFRVLAAIFGVLTLALAYETVRSATHGIKALLGLGVPRLVMPGLINLALAVLTVSVATLTFRLARMQLTIARLPASTRDRTA